MGYYKDYDENFDFEENEDYDEMPTDIDGWMRYNGLSYSDFI